jgi:AcrR family transcriptional regulator
MSELEAGMAANEAKPGRSAQPKAAGAPLRLRDEQRRLTRQRLREGAQQVFADRGFFDATIDEIVAHAGASRGTFYLYYKSKTEILKDLMQEVQNDAATLARTLADMRELSHAELETWIDAFVEMYAHHRNTFAAWAQAETVEPDLKKRGYKDYNRFWDIVFDPPRTAKAVGAAEREAARIRSILMMIMLDRFCYFWFVEGWSVDRAIAVGVLTDIWQQTLGPTLPAKPATSRSARSKRPTA